VVGGLEKVYEIARCFRNEGMDPSHLQDFSMLEWYAAYWDWTDNMAFTERLIRSAVLETTGSTEVVLNGTKVDFGGTWPRVSFRELIKKDADVDIEAFPDATSLRAAIRARGLEIEDMDVLGRGNLIDALYKKVSRPKLVGPLFLCEHPIDLSPLARRNDATPHLTDRFQVVVKGWEIVNAYSELVDPIDQRQRFEEQAALKAGGDEDAMDMDEDYLLAMEHGMPPFGASAWGSTASWRCSRAPTTCATSSCSRCCARTDRRFDAAMTKGWSIDHPFIVARRSSQRMRRVETLDGLGGAVRAIGAVHPLAHGLHTAAVHATEIGKFRLERHVVARHHRGAVRQEPIGDALLRAGRQTQKQHRQERSLSLGHRVGRRPRHEEIETAISSWMLSTKANAFMNIESGTVNASERFAEGVVATRHDEEVHRRASREETADDGRDAFDGADAPGADEHGRKFATQSETAANLFAIDRRTERRIDGNAGHEDRVLRDAARDKAPFDVRRRSSQCFTTGEHHRSWMSKSLTTAITFGIADAGLLLGFEANGRRANA
jgi:elongation factor P--beta-lysine ligase